MAKYNVNPTRIERARQSGRLKTALRGHKLLKDKCDEMIRTFMSLIKQNKILRNKVEKELNAALSLFMIARCKLSDEQVMTAVQNSAAVKYNLITKTKNIMGLTVPEVICTIEKQPLKNNFLSTPIEFDRSIQSLLNLTDILVELANIEKTCDMLADEIEKTRRRINSLQYLMIPNTKETIKYITMKLDEDQRGQQIRIMKVKQIKSVGLDK
ncbi:MAG: V-type ATP synthase subunit D [Christensenellaceae bacterium]|nr:V-type ATP synthase subunit D [Christensenellaceae bacterium]